MIETETHDLIRVLRLNRGKANALDLELVQALTRAVEQAERERVPALVLTGAGSIFCAGVDLYRVLNGGEEYARPYMAAFTDFTIRLFTAELPLIIAANGHAVAGGALLVAFGDYRLMSGGKFGYTELHVGVPFPPAALEAVRFAVPSREIQSLVYSGATCSAEEARTRGFIDEVVPPAELIARALEVARHYASVPRETFVATKRQLRAATLERMREAEDQLHESTVAAWSSPAIQAHMRAYLDRVVKKKA